MALPKDWDALVDGPVSVYCFRCKSIACKPTRAYRLLTTGILEHLYLCQGCMWGSVVRYDPLKAEQFIVANYVTPGKKWQWLTLAKPPQRSGPRT